MSLDESRSIIRRIFFPSLIRVIEGVKNKAWGRSRVGSVFLSPSSTVPYSLLSTAMYLILFEFLTFYFKNKKFKCSYHTFAISGSY